MNLFEGLRSHLIEELTTLPDAERPGIIQYGKIDQTAGTTRVWYQRRSEDNAKNSSGVTLLEQTYIDLEVMSKDGELALEIAAEIKSILHGHKGLIGDTFRALEVWVLDAADDYEPRGQNDDEGLYVVALDIHVIH
jgi:hypothetical protein